MRSISVVLCTFNGERFLDEQMWSLRRQKGVDEIVAVDDHSTDDTMAILHAHAAEDPRVKVFWNEQRLGVTANFERAIRLARGEWIALSDQDDVWLPEKIARLRAAWDGEACLMHHATRKFRGRVPAALPARAGEGRKYSGRDVRRLLYRNTIVGHTTLVRADVARGLMPFPREVPHDWWIGVGAAVHGPVQYVDEFLVHYRIHATNAYHCAGSRLRRTREEYRLRVSLLTELAGWGAVPRETRRFVREFQDALRAAGTERGPWRLAEFYWRHATIFFGDGSTALPWGRRARKTFAACCGAVGQTAGRPDAETATEPWWRGKTRVGFATAAVAGLVLSIAAWAARADAALAKKTPQRSETIASAPVADGNGPAIVDETERDRPMAGATSRGARRQVWRLEDETGHVWQVTTFEPEGESTSPEAPQIARRGLEKRVRGGVWRGPPPPLRFPGFVPPPQRRLVVPLPDDYAV